MNIFGLPSVLFILKWSAGKGICICVGSFISWKKSFEEDNAKQLWLLCSANIARPPGLRCCVKVTCNYR